MVTKRDPPGARKRILDAAARVFATQGPSGARIDVIAAEAGVNKRMLYHYFGAKQDLFAAVIDDRLGSGLDLPGAARLLSEGAPLALMDLRLMVWAAIAGVESATEQAAGWQAGPPDGLFVQFRATQPTPGKDRLLRRLR